LQIQAHRQSLKVKRYWFRIQTTTIATFTIIETKRNVRWNAFPKYELKVVLHTRDLYVVDTVCYN